MWLGKLDYVWALLMLRIIEKRPFILRLSLSGGYNIAGVEWTGWKDMMAARALLGLRDMRRRRRRAQDDVLGLWSTDSFTDSFVFLTVREQGVIGWMGGWVEFR